MRIRMLRTKEVPLEGGGRLVFEAGSYYVTGAGTALPDELATEWIMAGEAEDEAGMVKKPEPPSEPIAAPEPAEGGLTHAEDGDTAPDHPAKRRRR